MPFKETARNWKTRLSTSVDSVVPRDTTKRSAGTDELNGSTSSTAIRIVDIGVGQSQGTRDYQEDRYRILKPDDPFGQSVAFFAVYDGHGGDAVSSFVESHLHDVLLDQLQNQHGRDAFDQTIKESFQEVDRQLRQNGIGETEGSTVSLALVDLRKGTMVTADLGDSYAFVGVQRDVGELEVVKLSQKQSPGEKSERQRIEKAGGRVYDDLGMARVGAINVSRALGDLVYKVPAPDEKATNTKDPSHPFSSNEDVDVANATGLAGANTHDMRADWISNIPHINYRSLTGARRTFLLLASDGIGEEKDCASSLAWVAREWGMGADATLLARKLAEKSSGRTSDNSTVVIVVFE